MTEATAKRRRVEEQQARKLFKESWTTIAIRVVEEGMQRLVESAPPQQDRGCRLGALRVARVNRVVAKAGWEAKK